MRLGLIGSSDGDAAAVERAAEHLLDRAGVTRAIYLGADPTFDDAVRAWAGRIVGEDPTDDAVWRRAAALAISGTSSQIGAFVRDERARRRLDVLLTIPAHMRTIEILADRVVVLVQDKAILDEDDIVSANILVFGKSDAPLVRKIGARWFVSPGALGSGGGLAILDDEEDDVGITILDRTGKPVLRETLAAARTAKVRVQGDQA